MCSWRSVGRMPIITMCVSTVLALASASLRDVRRLSSNPTRPSGPSSRGGSLISMLNWPSSVWKSGSAIAASTSSFFIAGSPASSTRFSSTSRPDMGRSVSKADSLSICANTSRSSRTFSRNRCRSARVNSVRSTSLPIRIASLGECRSWEASRQAFTPASCEIKQAYRAKLREVTDSLVWIDCEMTGLDLTKDALVEIAVLVTDSELNIIDEGVDIVIHADDAVLDTMPDIVREMHANSGLTPLVRSSTVTVAEAEAQVLEYVRRHIPDARTAPLCGNSIATDRGFIARDMPLLDAHLHYRMIDVSSIKELARRWYPRVYYAQPTKGLAHRALADIRESVQELIYYRQTLFVPLPGPSSDEAQAAAKAVLGESADTVD